MLVSWGSLKKKKKKKKTLGPEQERISSPGKTVTGREWLERKTETIQGTHVSPGIAPAGRGKHLCTGSSAPNKSMLFAVGTQVWLLL